MVVVVGVVPVAVVVAGAGDRKQPIFPVTIHGFPASPVPPMSRT